ncbi:RNA-guided endonuclease TnpB family protein [Enterococcus sp. LJL98]
MSVLKAYRFKIYPDEEQKRFFVTTFGCVRFTYNHLLIARQQAEGGKQTPATLKKDYPFLKQTDSLALANAQRNLEKAFRRYFTGKSDYPSLKNKSNPLQSYTTNNQGQTITLSNGYLKLPKLKSLVAVNCHREIQGVIKSATISSRNNEAFFVSILCSEEVVPLPKTKRTIELTYSVETLIASPSFEAPIAFNQEKLLERIDRVQRRLKVRGKAARKRRVPLAYAKNYQKQKAKLGRLQLSCKEKKENYFDQVSYALIREYDLIAIQKELPKEVLTGNFTKADWQAFLKKLAYKATWYGKEIQYL